MKLSSLLKKHGLESLKFNAKYLELEWKPTDIDQQASWELYIELITRITTQTLEYGFGNEKTALESIHSLFPTTREILKNKGRQCKEFTKIAIVVLNQIVRPFTTKWHSVSLNDGFSDKKQCELFRSELSNIQKHLKLYTQLLADIAEVEDLTDIEVINVL